MAARNLSPLTRLAMAATALLGAVAPPPPSPASTASQEASQQSAQNASESDMIFRSGENLWVSETTSDDLFAVGSTVTADGAGADHLIVAGGEVNIRGAAPQDLFAAGGKLRLTRAEIADDLVAVGGDIVAGPDLDIGGSAVLAGGTVRFEAPVDGDLRIGAGEIYLDSRIVGNARLSGDKVVLGPNARILGDLFYRTENLLIEPGAAVTGRTTRLTTPDFARPEDAGYQMGRFLLFAGLSFFVSYAVIVLALVFGLPRLMRSTSEELQSRPWRSLGIGALYALAVPILAVLLAMSAIGLPLAILLAAISVALTPIAFAVTAYCAGMIVREFATKKSNPPEKLGPRILWPLVGVVILFALTLIPLMGVAIWLVAMLFGLGALLQRAIGAFSPSRPPPAAPSEPFSA